MIIGSNLIRKKKVLWISAAAPFDKVLHAGGQIENFYIKHLNNDERYFVKLVSLCNIDEFNQISEDLDTYNLDNVLIPKSYKSIKNRIEWKLTQFNKKYNFLNKYGGFVNINYFNVIYKVLKNLRFEPDIVILQWTEIVLFIDLIKEIFPDSSFVCIEEDVTYLSYYRKIDLSHGIERKLWQLKYSKLKSVELSALADSDITILNNPKDLTLIEKDGINNGFIWVPFFHMYANVKRNNPRKDILFYGAMYRYENYASAIWFIENVLYKLSDDSIRFIIVGNKPNESLNKYKSDRVVITGFVESVEPYLEQCACLVAPLVLGAGVKIKILEGMSSGIPVLTNSIGIEGIPARKNKDYYHCETSEDYIKIIDNKLGTNEIEEIGKNGKEYIVNNYNYEKSFYKFADMLERL